MSKSSNCCKLSLHSLSASDSSRSSVELKSSESAGDEGRESTSSGRAGEGIRANEEVGVVIVPELSVERYEACQKTRSGRVRTWLIHRGILASPDSIEATYG